MSHNVDGSTQAAKAEIKRFSKVSGQRLNHKKTEGLLSGTLRQHATPPGDIKWCPEGQFIISLGVPIGYDFDEDAFWLKKYT